MRFLFPLFAAFLPGCLSVTRSIDGLWGGRCELEKDDAEDEDLVVDFAVELVELDDDEIGGEGSFLYKGTEYAGAIYGERFINDIEFDLDGSYEGQATRLVIFGEVESEAVDGECSLYGVEGDLTMAR